MQAKYFPASFVSNDFAYSVSVLVFRRISAAISHGEHCGYIIYTGFIGCFFCKAYRRSFGICINNRRYRTISHYILFPKHIVNAHFSLAIRGVSQHKTSRAVACGINLRQIGLPPAVGFNFTVYYLNTYIFKTDSICNRFSADAEQNLFGMNLLCFTAIFECNAFITYVDHLGIQFEINALFFMIF